MARWRWDRLQLTIKETRHCVVRLGCGSLRLHVVGGRLRREELIVISNHHLAVHLGGDDEIFGSVRLGGVGHRRYWGVGIRRLRRALLVQLRTRILTKMFGLRLGARLGKG